MGAGPFPRHAPGRRQPPDAPYQSRRLRLEQGLSRYCKIKKCLPAIKPDRRQAFSFCRGRGREKRGLDKGAAPAFGAAQPVDAVTELQRFKALLDQGVITQADFDAKKRQLLGL
ncbi:MAG: SHOCT domain-containing protein [Oscillospiraceae bacterium]|nr:SHOCT domain-containing protein [Oscillospiraceae bacterium]